MKAIKTIIKLSENKINVIVQNLRSLEKNKAILLYEIENYKSSLQRESELIDSIEEKHKYNFEQYMINVLAKIDDLQSKAISLEKKIDKIQEKLQELYTEKTKYDIILRKKIEAELVLEKISEDNDMDFITTAQVNQRLRNKNE